MLLTGGAQVPTNLVNRKFVPPGITNVGSKDSNFGCTIPDGSYKVSAVFAACCKRLGVSTTS